MNSHNNRLESPFRVLLVTTHDFRVWVRLKRQAMRQGKMMRILMTILLGLVSQPLFAESIFMVPGQSWGFQFNSPKLEHHQGLLQPLNFSSRLRLK
ncbi:MAG: hypothetical protein WBM41_10295 [Arenicellales bacterium]